MKTTMKLLAAGTFATLLFFVGNVNAEGKQAKASGHENIEQSMQVESWMTDERIWNASETGTEILLNETDSELKVEEWMVDSNTWLTDHLLIVNKEEKLYVEDWMTNQENWNKTEILVEKEDSLKTENWMFENSVWKR